MNLAGSPGGISTTILVVVSFDSQDTIETSIDTINLLAGVVVPTGKKYTKIGDMHISYFCI